MLLNITAFLLYARFLKGKNSCLPGSAICSDKHTLSFCSADASWISLKCPENSYCSMSDGKLGCTNKKESEEIDETGEKSDFDNLFNTKSKKDKKKKPSNIESNEDEMNSNDNSEDSIMNIKDESKNKKDKPKKSKTKKPKKENKHNSHNKKDNVKTKTVYKHKKTVTVTKQKEPTKTESNSNKSNHQNKNENKTESGQPNNYGIGTMQPSISTKADSPANDSLLKTLAEMISKAKEKTVTQTITEKTAPREIKLEYTGPGQVSSTGSFSSGGSSSGNSSGGSSSTENSSNPSSSNNSSSGNSSSNNSSSGNSSSNNSSSGNSSSGNSSSGNNSGNTSSGSGSSNTPSSSSSGNSKPSSSNSSSNTSPSSSSQSSGNNSNNASSSGNNSNNTQNDKNKNTSNSNSNKSSDSKDSKDSKGNQSNGGNIIDKDTLMQVMKECNFSPNEEYLNAVVDGVNKNWKDKDMAAQFLAQIAHESGGFQYVEEIACAGNTCPGQYGSDQGAPGKQYYGRGFMQLSWPDNYKNASADLYGNSELYDDPDKVAKDTQKAYDVSQWFWDKNVKGKEGVGPDHFGYSTKAINGELECKNNNNIDKSKKRYDIYTKMAKAMNIEKVADEAGCYTT
ncbi:Endochitinase [Ecytonucleospora hepatopenaei]|uniref:Endochitinase n=1 Tax=Ecytonucleospora hepatopenaei TaxID=646526 RepID=A0A1W0E5C1_9MICR|nr:Endochitinase [Ecytonucleospora hepatopenaei]